MKFGKSLLCSVAALGALAGNAHAQTNTNEFTAIGSSALFLEVGHAAIARATTVASGLPGGPYNVCTWSTKDSNSNGLPYRIYSNDQSPAITNTGNFFAVWTQTPACGTDPAAGDTVDIWSYLQADSSVGNRCVFRTGTTAQECVLVVPPQQVSGTNTVTGTAGANLISSTDTPALPSDIINATNGELFGVAASDIRPEDSQFAIYRALQSTSTALGTAPGAVYYGLGLASASNPCATIAVTGSSYDSATPGSVTAAGFALPGGTDPCSGAAAVNVVKVTPVGATPVMIAVNPSGTNSGFNGSINILRGELAGLLDGELCRTSDIVPSLYHSGSPNAITFIREPFSGTYSTVEYNVPETRGIQGSQETGASISQPTTWTTCNGKGGSRQRVTSTGNMVAAIQNTPFSIGYFFFSVGNAKNFTTANGKYLQVDGVDPILNTYSKGCIPVAAGGTNCNLSYITFAHVKDGSYPIWSVQRFITTCATGANCVPAQQAEAALVSTAAQNDVISGSPDFTPVKFLHAVHAHYLPPVPASAGIQGTLTVSNGDCPGSVESGGDIGGVVYSLQADGDYCSDFGVTTGIVNIVGNGTTTNGNPGQRQ